MGITEAELQTLETANTAEEWNAACAAIKAVRGGIFPEDWYPRVMQAGVLKRFGERSKVDTGIHVEPVRVR
jgi:hypothetical protein